MGGEGKVAEVGKMFYKLRCVGGTVVGEEKKIKFFL